MATIGIADFLLPEGFTAPGRAAVLREVSVVTEAGRLALARMSGHVGAPRTPYADSGAGVSVSSYGAPFEPSNT